MKKIFFILLFFSNLIVFSQENYHFDYYTLYENKQNSLDSNPIKEMFFSNSKDNSYLLSIIIKKDTIYSAELFDYSKLKLLIFKNDLVNNKINDYNIFNSISSFKYDLENCKNTKKSFYEINYDSVLNKKRIIIKRYKNSRKKKLINQSFYETIPSEITQNQHYNFGVLVNPLWCQKFVLNNNELITDSYFLANGNKEYIRHLLEIKTIDFALNVSSNNSIKN